MTKRSPELINARREEIINACEKLYKTMGFKEITIAQIAQETSFTRTSIYNYFQTKEEIFMALLVREYNLWIADIQSIMSKNEKMSKDDFAKALAHSLESRAQLLKILSMNHYDMESESRMERLKELKVAYGNSMRMVVACLDKFFPEMTLNDKQNFQYAFFPFMFGIYPYTFVNDKQRQAMEETGIDYIFMTIYEITYNFVKQLLKDIL